MGSTLTCTLCRGQVKPALNQPAFILHTVYKVEGFHTQSVSLIVPILFILDQCSMHNCKSQMHSISLDKQKELICRLAFTPFWNIENPSLWKPSIIPYG